MIYQLISIGVEQNRIKELEQKIAEYSRLIEDGENTIEVRKLKWWIEREARELGYVYPDDITHD